MAGNACTHRGRAQGRMDGGSRAGHGTDTEGRTRIQRGEARPRGRHRLRGEAPSRAGFPGWLPAAGPLRINCPHLRRGFNGVGLRDHRLGRVRIRGDAFRHRHLDEQQPRRAGAHSSRAARARSRDEAALKHGSDRGARQKTEPCLPWAALEPTGSPAPSTKRSSISYTSKCLSTWPWHIHESMWSGMWERFERPTSAECPLTPSTSQCASSMTFTCTSGG